jgi:glucose/arabinose dehydrogenase/PKD repeat protein
VGGLSDPMTMAWAPDGRLFIAEKPGRLKVVAPGGSTATTILDISSRVNHANDRGLLGLAVDSDFASNGYIYLSYTYDVTPLTADSDGAMVSRVGRFTVGANNSVSAETVVLGSYAAGPCPAASNTLDCIPSDGLSHSIGTVLSAPDGTLWIGSGDAADYNRVDPLAFRTYDERSLAGKILHTDRDGRGLPGHSSCPADNDLTHVCTKIHSKGFRNPFRFKLRPNGGLTVGDVGWSTREEVDLIAAPGKSYGWPCYEGTIRTPGYKDRAECAPEYAKEGTAAAHVAPSHDYPHGSSGNAAMGGPEYTGAEYPAGYRGDVFFADYAGGFIRRLELAPDGSVAGVASFAGGWAGVELREMPNGDLAYSDGSTSIKRIVYTPGNRSPLAGAGATPTSGQAPLPVQFSSTASSDPDGDALTYRWDFGDGSAESSQAGPSHTYTQNGTYTARLTVSDGRGLTDSATVTIAVGNQAPVARIDAPLDESLYRASQSIQLRGTASDPQDGMLPASAYRWTVKLFHADHVHPVNSFDGVAAPSFTTGDDHDADSYFEVTLTVTDSGGLSGSQTIQLRPETVRYTLASSPAGAPLSYAGLAGAGPMERSSAIGFRTTISAGERFVSGGREYVFDRWSDGAARQHDVVVPAADSTVTAFYRDAGPANGLVAAFGFEEGSGNRAGDASGRGNDGIAAGATWTAAGRNGKALSFDGVDDWLTVADSPSLDLSTAMSLEAWVKPNVIAKPWQTLFVKEGAGTFSYALYATAGGSAQVNAWWTESDNLYVPPLAQGAWSHLALTSDGTTMRIYVDGVQVGAAAVSGVLPNTAGPLRIAGNAIWNDEFFDGTIDDVRVYDRALSQAEVLADRDTPVGGGSVPPPPPPDTTPPNVTVTSPAGGATVSGSVEIQASASDDVGLQGVQFKVDGQDVGSLDTTAPYRVPWDTRSAANGSHQLTAVARDSAGNTTTSNGVAVTVQNDSTPPTVSVTAPANGSTVSGAVTVRAAASDDVGVQDVQFRLDGQNLGGADTSAPYELSWDTRTASSGSHQLTAVARDAAGNSRTSSPAVSVTVQNQSAVPGLVAAFGFEEASGAAVADASGRGNAGLIAGAARTAAGKNGRALSFDGVDDWLTVADSPSLDLSTGMTLEAWVKPDLLSKPWQALFLKEAPNSFAYALYLTAGGSAQLNAWWTGSQYVYAPPIQQGAWTHVAVTAGASVMRFYVNGTQVRSKAITGSLPATSGPLRIGGTAVWANEFFDGTLDDVRVYDRALSAAQVQQDRNTPVG